MSIPEGFFPITGPIAPELLAPPTKQAWTIYDPASGAVVGWQEGGHPPEPPPGLARLEGLWPAPDWRVVDGVAVPAEPAEAEPPTRVIYSLLPVALRRALRATPAPEGSGNALDYVLAALATPGMEDARDAFEYMVRAERADMVSLGAALGFEEEAIDAVLALAATYPGADAISGPAP